MPKAAAGGVFVLSVILLGAWSAATTSLADESGWEADPRRLGLLKPASQLIDRPVQDRRDKPVGKIQDLLLDVPSRRVLVTLISTPGASPSILVPAESYTFVSKGKLVIGEEKSAFKNAPRVPTAVLGVGVTAKQLQDSFAYLHQQLPKAAANSQTKLCWASSLLRAPLLGQNNEALGQVNDLMVDLPRGLVVYLVVQPTANADSATELYVVPAVSVRPDVARQVILLDTDQTHFLAGPHFSNDFWTDLAFSEMAKAVCRHYGLQYDGLVPPGLHGTGAGSNGTLAQNLSPDGERSDAEITQAVLEEIMQPAHGFVNLDIIVTTLNGRVTLTGIAKNEKQKKQVLTFVEHVAGIGKVEDRLETHGKSNAARL